jgi:hypothetical protein
VSDYPTEDCRSCNAPIIWTVTERGKAMPVDAEPAEGGNLAIDWDIPGQLRVRSRVVKPHLAFGRKDLHRSHFVLCPDAAKWRQRQTGGDAA